MLHRPVEVAAINGHSNLFKSPDGPLCTVQWNEKGASPYTFIKQQSNCPGKFYPLYKGLSIRVEVERFKLDGTELDFFSAGVNYLF